jgi:hypothetical protein
LTSKQQLFHSLAIVFLLSVTSFFLISGAGMPSLAAQNESSRPTGTVWKGPGGEVLPFDSYQEIEGFLLKAAVVHMEEIPEGVTDPKKVLLEKDGVQARAIFRDVDISKARGPGMGGKGRLNFRDFCLFEVAAYQLAQMLGLDNVPPTIRRKIKGQNGTLQIWVEGAMTEKGRLKDGVQPPSPWHHAMQHQIMRIFDNLVYNEDRNQGNVLYDENWKMWMIDHTRAFRMDKELPKPEEIQICEKDLWEKLRNLDDAALTERLDDLLKTGEMEGLVARKRALVKWIERLIEEKSEKRALFTYFEPRKASP